MNKDLYYLSHPYKTFGNPFSNIGESWLIKLKLENKDMTVISPLNIVPRITDDEDRAWIKCINLLACCDSIILSGEWEKSDGCLKELELAKKLNMKVYVLKNNELEEIKYE